MTPRCKVLLLTHKTYDGRSVCGQEADCEFDGHRVFWIHLQVGKTGTWKLTFENSNTQAFPKP